MHVVGNFLADLALDLAGPLSAFEKANSLSGRELYALHVISEHGGLVHGSSGLPVQTSCFEEFDFDTVIFVGGEVAPMFCPGAVTAAKALASRTGRVASVCSGAFLLAEAALLDGRRATTHWRLASNLQQRYPAVKVETDRIYTADGRIWTSAGVAARIDLALALIEIDHNVRAAREVARELVVPHRRPGGQSQFSAMSQMDPDSDRIRMALAFAREHLVEHLSVERLAETAPSAAFASSVAHSDGELVRRQQRPWNGFELKPLKSD